LQRFIFILLFILSTSCSKEEINNSIIEPSATLGDTYISHRFKDQLKTTQLISRLNLIFPNADSLVNPKYDITVFRIFYKTHDFQNNEITASGLVYVPEITRHHVPIVCYQHGTVFHKEEVPSIIGDLSYFAPFILASESGAIVCAADYIGLGFSDGIQHYFEPTEEANAVIDMLGSVQILLNKTYHSLTFNNEVYLTGYSQGGHATLAAQRRLETLYRYQFQIKASAPMASFFSFEKSSQLNLMKDSINSTYACTYAFLINSIQSTQNVYSSYKDIFISPYDSLTNIIFNGTYYVNYVNAVYPNYFYNTLQPSFRNDFKNNPNNIFLKAIKKYDVINDWIPKAPTHFYHSQGDEIAYYENSVIAYNTFKQNGGHVELNSLGNISHLDGNIAAIKSVREWFYPNIKITPY
jgi:hypothetical protein